MLITCVLEREAVGCGVQDGTRAGIQLQEGRSQTQTRSTSSPQDLQQLRQLFCGGRGIKKDFHDGLGHFKIRAVKCCQGWFADVSPSRASSKIQNPNILFSTNKTQATETQERRDHTKPSRALNI